MNTKTWGIVWLVVITGVVVLAVCTLMAGGLYVTSTRDFGGQRDVQLTPGLKSDLWLAPTSSTVGVPFVFQHYKAGKPFGLRIQIWDDSRRYRAIEITEVVLEYQDGDVVRNTDTWSRQLEPSTQYHSSPAGIHETSILMLSDQLEGLVRKHADVRITLKGQLIMVDGKQVPFETSESFTAESRRNTTTGWEHLAGC
jgi:hypothetical protein